MQAYSAVSTVCRVIVCTCSSTIAGGSRNLQNHVLLPKVLLTGAGFKSMAKIG